MFDLVLPCSSKNQLWHTKNFLTLNQTGSNLKHGRLDPRLFDHWERVMWASFRNKRSDKIPWRVAMVAATSSTVLISKGSVSEYYWIPLHLYMF